MSEEGKKTELPTGTELTEEETEMYFDSEMCSKTSKKIMEQFLRAHGHITREGDEIRTKLWCKIKERLGLDFIETQHVLLWTYGMKLPIVMTKKEHSDWARKANPFTDADNPIF